MPAAHALPYFRWRAALASVMLHGMLLCALVFADSGDPVGATGAGGGVLSVLEVGLLTPPHGSGGSELEPQSAPLPDDAQEPDARPEDARPQHVDCPQKNGQQPAQARWPERTKARAAAVAGIRREGGVQRQHVGESPDHSGGAAGGPAALDAAVGDGRPFGFSLGEVGGKPKVVKSVQVVYPVEARKKGITGQVLVRFHLDENGAVSHLHIKSAQPPDIFNRNTLAAVSQWRFQPASHNSKAVPVWVELPIMFELR